jgi:hypothetical protein
VDHNELKRNWKEVVVTCFKVLSWSEHGRTKENLPETQDISVSDEIQAGVCPKYKLETFSLKLTYLVADNNFNFI